MSYILIAIIGYFLGNISSSYLVGKLGSNVDVRDHGSGNLGTTNAFRVLGLKAGAIVFIGDVLKGIAATLIGLWIKGSPGAFLGGMAAVVGHNWPFLLGFKGGKGVATSFGLIIVLYPLLALILFVVEILVIVFTGYVSLGSIMVAILFPILTIIFKYETKQILGALLLGGLVIFRHRSNISRLLNGTENKVTGMGRGRRKLK